MSYIKPATNLKFNLLLFVIPDAGSTAAPPLTASLIFFEAGSSPKSE